MQFGLEKHIPSFYTHTLMQSELKIFLHIIKVLLNTRHPSGLFFSFSPLFHLVDCLYAEIKAKLLGLLKMEVIGIFILFPFLF